MTTFLETQVVCSACGARSQHTVLTSTSAFGSPDLDFRPPEMARWTLSHGIQECPTCGYAGDISDPLPPNGRETLASPRYQQLGTSEYPSTARAYLRAALLNEAAGELATAGMLAQRAAWDCDDHNPQLAPACRREAVRLLQAAREAGDSFGERRVDENCLLVDLLRRAGQFTEAAALVEATAALPRVPRIVAQLLQFQKQLIEREDVAGYTMEEALGDSPESVEPAYPRTVRIRVK